MEDYEKIIDKIMELFMLTDYKNIKWTDIF